MDISSTGKSAKVKAKEKLHANEQGDLRVAEAMLSPELNASAVIHALTPTHSETGEKQARTAHSLNPVPAYVYDPAGSTGTALSNEADLGISSLAATCISLLGFEPPEGYTPSVVTVAGGVK